MAWLSALTGIIYYFSLPVIALVQALCDWLLIVLAPLLYMCSCIVAIFLLPLKFLGGLEILYVYFGIAAIIGLITGSMLHFSSTTLVSVFNLAPTITREEKPENSVQSTRRQKLHENIDDALSSKNLPLNQHEPQGAGFLVEEYGHWLEKDILRRREESGLLGEIILEEDDSEN